VGLDRFLYDGRVEIENNIILSRHILTVEKRLAVGPLALPRGISEPDDRAALSLLFCGESMNRPRA